MPRLARLDVPDTLLHIMIMGIEHRNIFKLQKGVKAGGIFCIGRFVNWAFHLLNWQSV
ncbi:hypothetical protein ACFL7M_02395 [Thermodesulfobacteriota bacterium]